MRKRIVLLLNLFWLAAVQAKAQEVEMADGFRAEGKIYIVVGVILIILIGLFVYLFRIERKVKKLEQE